MKAIVTAVLAVMAVTAGGAAAKPKPVMHVPVQTLPVPPLPAQVVRTYAMPDAPIAAAAAVPSGYTTVYLSGMVPAVTHPEAEKGSIASYGTTEEQTESVLGKMQAALKAQGLDFKDLVSMHVYLVGDPANGGKMDFAGMMKSYSRHFGTPDQQDRPTRVTVQVAALGAPGFLVEIEAVAVKPAQ